jgi:hypothetical protein
MNLVEDSHQKPASFILLLTLLEDIDCLDGHLLQTWLVCGVCSVTNGGIFLIVKVLGKYLPQSSLMTITFIFLLYRRLTWRSTHLALTKVERCKFSGHDI